MNTSIGNAINFPEVPALVLKLMKTPSSWSATRGLPLMKTPPLPRALTRIAKSCSRMRIRASGKRWKLSSRLMTF